MFEANDMAKFGKWKRALRFARHREARRIVVLVLGIIVLAVGAVLIFIPGPALVVIPAGIAILAIEFSWARKLSRKARNWLTGARAKTKAAFSPKRR